MATMIGRMPGAKMLPVRFVLSNSYCLAFPAQVMRLSLLMFIVHYWLLYTKETTWQGVDSSYRMSDKK